MLSISWSSYFDVQQLMKQMFECLDAPTWKPGTVEHPHHELSLLYSMDVFIF